MQSYHRLALRGLITLGLAIFAFVISIPVASNLPRPFWLVWILGGIVGLIWLQSAYKMRLKELGIEKTSDENILDD